MFRGQVEFASKLLDVFSLVGIRALLPWHPGWMAGRAAAADGPGVPEFFGQCAPL